MVGLGGYGEVRKTEEIDGSEGDHVGPLRTEFPDLVEAPWGRGGVDERGEGESTGLGMTGKEGPHRPSGGPKGGCLCFFVALNDVVVFEGTAR